MAIDKKHCSRVCNRHFSLTAFVGPQWDQDAHASELRRKLFAMKRYLHKYSAALAPGYRDNLSRPEN